MRKTHSKGKCRANSLVKSDYVRFKNTRKILRKIVCLCRFHFFLFSRFGLNIQAAVHLSVKLLIFTQKTKTRSHSHSVARFQRNEEMKNEKKKKKEKKKENEKERKTVKMITLSREI